MQRPITIIMGKSGSGKNTILEYLVKHYNFNPIITWTTRPKRKNEKDGIDYYFVNKNIFSDEVLQNNFVEYRVYNTFENGKSTQWYYGLHKKRNNIDLTKQNILITTYDGCIKTLNYFGEKSCNVIYIDVPYEIRNKRAKQRGSFDEKEWNRRKIFDDKDFEWNKIKKIVNKKIKNVNKNIKEICEEIIK